MPTDPVALLSAWDWPATPSIEPADSGLINRSWVVRAGGRPVAVLQRLNTAVFSPVVHEDIEAVTRHLAAKGLATTSLQRTRDGRLWIDDEEGFAWRCLGWVGAETIHKLGDPARAFSAGRLVAQVHAALADFEWTFRSVRPGAHDTPLHMKRLAEAVAASPDHRLHAQVAEVADAILGRWDRWEGGVDLPIRVLHGDLKVSNLRFEGDRAVAVVDLDTFQHGTLDTEMGDAFRSWCNPASEDSPAARFDLAVFDAAIRGYAVGALSHGPTEAEWASIVPGIERIALELAARFARDALEESYFGWNAKYGTRGDHNLLRARGQLDLARTAAHAAPHARRKLDLARQAATGSRTRSSAT